MSDQEKDLARMVRVTEHVEHAMNHDMWLVGAWHVDARGQIQAKIEWQNWRYNDFPTVMRQFRARVGERILTPVKKLHLPG